MTISTEGPRDLFGELYLRSTRPFLPDAVSDAEAEYLEARFVEGGVQGPVLDLGCGHGRHLKRLALRRSVIGLDGDPLSLAEAKAGAPVVRADFFALPFRAGSFGAAVCWYNTLGTFADAAVPLALRELARCIRPGGWLVVQGTPPHVPRAHPHARWQGPLPDGCTLEEEVGFNAALSRDELTRRLTAPDGRLMAASFFIRYYAVSEWEALLDAAGFTVRWVHGAVDASAFSETSIDQIVGAQRRG